MYGHGGMDDTASFLLVLVTAAAAPLVAAGAGRLRAGLVVPVVVVELVLGALIGPDVLGLAEMNDILDFLDSSAWASCSSSPATRSSST